MAFVIFFSLHTRAGLLEVLSHGAYSLSNGDCPDYDPTEATTDLHQLECNCSVSNQAIQDQTQSLLPVVNYYKGNSEDRFFVLLARQHAKELSCAASFADKVANGDSSVVHDLEEKIRLMRAARQLTLAATNNIASDSSIAAKVCPTTITDLQESPAFPKGEDRYYNNCQVAIRSRIAFEMVYNSIPFANLPPVKRMLEKYSNMKDGAEFNELDSSLGEKVRNSFADAKDLLNSNADKLNQSGHAYEGGKTLDRSTRYELLSDPRVVQKVVEDGGNTPNLKALACRADARFGKGADSLETDLFIGSLAFSGGAGIVARVGSAGFKIAEGVLSARAAGMLSINATRALQYSAIIANGISAYSEIDKQCGEKISRYRGNNSDKKGECVSSPRVEQLAGDKCVLDIGLHAIGFLAPFASVALSSPIPKYVSDQVSIIWYPKAGYQIMSHVNIKVEDKVYETFLGTRFKGTAEKIEQSANTIGHGYFEFKLKVTEEELNRLKVYLESIKNKASFQSCISGTCKVIRRTTEINIPPPFRYVPSLSALYLTAAKSLGYSRIASIRYVGPNAIKSFAGADVPGELVLAGIYGSGGYVIVSVLTETGGSVINQIIPIEKQE